MPAALAATAAAPADTVPGTAIDTYVPPRRTTPPATRPATRPPSPRPTTGRHRRPADGTRLCLRTNLGEVGVLEVRPDPDGDRRPEPYAIRVARA